ncbi:site-specific integrase [Pseudomonas umsongensis]|nr:site-specific integrase [Pseudomonas umsongensis]
MTSILMYANWLEQSKTDWWYFPVKKADRCLVRFRGHLIVQRDSGLIAPSTATQRMRDVINFYRWLRANGFLTSDWPLWKEKFVSINFTNAVGFDRTIAVQTTDLAIKNRKLNIEKLEDGLIPVSAEDRDKILEFARDNASWETYLFLMLGFYTGMRIGTLSDLKVETLRRAVPDPQSRDLYKIAIGPGARPSVKTKFGVTGFAWITKPHLELILIYVDSQQRQDRVSKAKEQNKNLVFLTRHGNPYTTGNTEKSSALNVEMHNLRKKSKATGNNFLEGFYFHRSRATFATQLAILLVPIAGVVNALAIIKDALLHKDEATSLRYIKFIERTPAKAKIANEFSRVFLSILSEGRSDDE